MQHDVPVIKSISFFGTVTGSDAAAVACLNVITGMKGRILIKTISPSHLLPSPLFKSWAGGCVCFSGFFTYAFLLRNISNHQAIAYCIMSMSSPLPPPCWELAEGMGLCRMGEWYVCGLKWGLGTLQANMGIKVLVSNLNGANAITGIYMVLGAFCDYYMHSCNAQRPNSSCNLGHWKQRPAQMTA